MARLYAEFCIWCRENTQWVHHDLEPGRSDNCTKCGKHIYQQNKDDGERRPRVLKRNSRRDR